MPFPKDLISITDLNQEQIMELIQLAKNLKENRFSHEQPLKGKTVGLLTTKPSLRTRLSFEVGLFELGANSLFIKNDEVGLGVRESYADVANVISRYLAALIVRSHDHKGLIQLAQNASIPVINALTDAEHPCQALADLLTIYELFGELKAKKLTYLGDGNNVAVSLMLASAITGIEFTAITPAGYEPPKEAVNIAAQLAKKNGSPTPIITNDANHAAEADVLYTDVWVSMGQEGSKEKVSAAFTPYQINSTIMQDKQIPVLHCLPAHKGEEISEKAFEVNKEIIFQQAENRLHAQKALLTKLLVKTV
jgi:ornithine carbamoyltransferase